MHRLGSPGDSTGPAGSPVGWTLALTLTYLVLSDKLTLPHENNWGNTYFIG